MDWSDFFFTAMLVVLGVIGGAMLLWAWLVWPLERADRRHHLSGDDYETARERHPSYYSGPAAMDEF